nr:MAG TPA: U1 small nuclear ribonucleoprotein [Caudoviricetes sp.]DAZ25347.1 MAG TPA: U1 small nuclear ribonucleoprotein [Caudoviricetes sp.]
MKFFCYICNVYITKPLHEGICLSGFYRISCMILRC